MARRISGPALAKTNEDGSRFYTFDGQQYWSVTTLINAGLPKFLHPWYAKRTADEALDFLAKPNPTADELVGWAMKAGELNLTVMGLLDAANTDTYGHPEPTQVRVTPKKGKCIAVKRSKVICCVLKGQNLLFG